MLSESKILEKLKELRAIYKLYESVMFTIKDKTSKEFLEAKTQRDLYFTQAVGLGWVLQITEDDLNRLGI